jgi:acyl-homoserine-lactone acylase
MKIHLEVGPLRTTVLGAAVVLLLAAPARATHEPSSLPPSVVIDGAGSPAPSAAELPRHLADDPDPPRYEALIRRTAYGVAHIQAANLPSLGFGEGYAQAEDHVCTIADQVVRARGERARYFGRGEGDAHLNSDIAARSLRLHADAAAWHAERPAEVQAWVEGFVAGYNRYLEETGRESVAGWCRGAEWVIPITTIDLAAVHRMVFSLIGLASSIAAARPPAAAEVPSSTGASSNIHSPEFLSDQTDAASNGWALGRDRTRSGGGILVANPHFPWTGMTRFWEKHLTIPGELDVYGVNLIGMPGVGIGFNEHVAWTFTSSAASHVTVYALDLVPGQPTRYRYGDEERDMVPIELSIPVAGEEEPVRHTSWSTHYGLAMRLGPLPWTPERAFAIRFSGEGYHQAMLADALDKARARSMQEFQRAAAEHQATTGLTTVAVSRDGIAWFFESAGIPNLSREALEIWTQRRERDPVTRGLWEASRMVLLDGSDPRFEWQDNPGAAHPGRVPFERLPQLERTDYVFNANSPFWLPHAEARLEGDYSPLLGAQRGPLSLRARQNALHLADPSAGPVDRRHETAAVLSNRSLTADLLNAELVERCRETPRLTTGEEVVDLSAACAVLAAWDRRFDLDSRGAVLFREWIGQYDLRGTDWRVEGPPDLFAIAFDPDDPLNTPRGLAPGPLALENLAKAVLVLQRRAIALDTPLGELQYAPSKLPRRMPVHGATEWEGALNLMLIGATPASATTLEPTPTSPRVSGSPFLTEAGYPILHGSSFILAVELTADGPLADAILTYGQSGDPESEHFTDQTEMFARKEWRPVLFREADIAREVRREYVVRGGDGARP